MAALGCGLLFGVGLAVSQMTDPNKVLSFLNLAGGWDPSLLFVMGSALIVTAIGYRLGRQDAPVLDSRFHLPKATDIDLKLVSGAAIFGIGWGLGGFCPGPAVAAISSGLIDVLVFVVALVAGGWLTNALLARKPESR